METAVETWVHSLSAKIAERPPQEQSTTCAVSGSISWSSLPLTFLKGAGYVKVFANDHGSLGGPYPKNLTIALISHREATLGISPQNPRRTDRDPLFVTDSSNRLQESTPLLQHHPARNSVFIIPSYRPKRLYMNIAVTIPPMKKQIAEIQLETANCRVPLIP